MRQAARVDANQEAIVAGLRRAGCSIQILARIGGGCPDILVGHSGKNWLMEIKTDGGTQNQTQLDWAKTWRGQTDVVRSLYDALAIVGLKRFLP